jgi:hypothetical protein
MRKILSVALERKCNPSRSRRSTTLSSRERAECLRVSKPARGGSLSLELTSRLNAGEICHNVMRLYALPHFSCLCNCCARAWGTQWNRFGVTHSKNDAQLCRGRRWRRKSFAGGLRGVLKLNPDLASPLGQTIWIKRLRPKMTACFQMNLHCLAWVNRRPRVLVGRAPSSPLRTFVVKVAIELEIGGFDDDGKSVCRAMANLQASVSSAETTNSLRPSARGLIWRRGYGAT